MSSMVRLRFVLLAAAVAAAVTGCVPDGETVEADPTAAAVVFEGATYAPREFAALGVSPVHFVSTVESARDGVVYAFATPEARAAFTASVPRAPAPAAAFNRNNSKFYEDPSYDKKLLEVGVGESVRDLAAHPCNCNQMISSIKASQDARWTVVYDAVELNPDFGDWWIASGAEIENLATIAQANDGDDDATWVNDISSIEVRD